MSIWGKIFGGAAGFALGGPLGALVGAVGGHVIDRLRKSQAGREDATKSVAFTIGVIALGAKMAKADGVVTDDEIAAFRHVFQVPPEEEKNVTRVFDRARKDTRGYELYARQIAGMFRDNPAVLEELLWCLSYIAKADGRIHPAELEFLSQVSDTFGLDRAAFERVTALQMSGDDADPYRVLGVAPTTDDAGLRAAHRRLVLENHPDRLIAQGMPEETIAVANAKLAAINAAYDRIRADRGLS